MIPLTKRQISLFAMAGAALAVLFAVYLLLYQPLFSGLKAARQKYSGLEKEVRQARDTLGQRDAGSLPKGLVTEGEISSAIDEVTRAGKRREVNFISLTPKHTEPIKDPRFKIVPIEMETESSFQSLGEFLGSFDDLEKSFVTVEQYEIYPDAKNPALLKARIVIHMYFLR